MKKVVSYQRFSSKGQIDNDSIRRQTEEVERFCNSGNYELVDILIDPAISGWKGKNLDENGKLDILFKLIQSNKISCDIIFIEDWDRLSRLKLHLAFPLFTSIMELGVELHTQGGGVFSKEILDKEPWRYMQIIPSMIVSNQKSEILSQRVSAAWIGKFKKIKNGDLTILTKTCPSWLKVVDDKFQLNQHAKTVQNIFSWYSDGLTYGQIIKRLTEANTPTLKGSRDWKVYTLMHLLKNRKVLGEFTFKNENVIKDYYPQIIDDATWNAVAAKKGKTRKGRWTAEDPNKNIFRGLMKCGCCGTSLHITQNKKHIAKPYYSIFGDHRECEGNKYLHFEHFEKQFIDSFLWQIGDFDPTKSKDKNQQDLLNLKNSLEVNQNEQKELQDTMLKTKKYPAFMVERMNQLEAEAKELSKNISNLCDKGSEIELSISSKERWKEMLKRYDKLDFNDPENRKKLYQFLHQTVQEIKISANYEIIHCRKKKDHNLAQLKLYDVDVYLKDGTLLSSNFENLGRNADNFYVGEGRGNHRHPLSA